MNTLNILMTFNHHILHDFIKNNKGITYTEAGVDSIKEDQEIQSINFNKLRINGFQTL